MDPVAEWIAMHLLCALGWHRPESTTIRNEGRHFGRCRRCKSDLIEVGRSWKLAPRGYQVVWKKSFNATPPAAEAVPTRLPDMVADAVSASPEIAVQAEVEAEAEAASEAETSAPAPLVRRARADRRAAKAAEPSPLSVPKERRTRADRRKPAGKKPDPRLA